MAKVIAFGGHDAKEIKLSSKLENQTSWQNYFRNVWKFCGGKKLPSKHPDHDRKGMVKKCFAVAIWDWWSPWEGKTFLGHSLMSLSECYGNSVENQNATNMLCISEQMPLKLCLSKPRFFFQGEICKKLSEFSIRCTCQRFKIAPTM